MDVVGGDGDVLAEQVFVEEGDDALFDFAAAEPMRAIVANAGLQPAPIVQRARCERQVYDVVRREWVDLWTGGIVDPLPVAVAALETSVSAIATALTSDVLIHRANAPMAVEP